MLETYINENMYCISGTATHTQTHMHRALSLLSVPLLPNSAIHICCCRKQ